MNSVSESTFRPKLWVPGDLNAFFGLFSNVMLNVLVLTGLCLFILKFPEGMVYGRILPALGIALSLGNIFYAYLAWKLAKKEQRDTVTTLPYGPSVPQMFIVVFLVMMPAYIATKDSVLAWRLGLIWALIVGIVVLFGVVTGPTIRKYTPRAAMLGTLAGVAIAFISLRPAFQIFSGAWIGLLCFMILLLNWVGRVRLPFGIPGGLAVVVIGSGLAWGSVALGLTDMMKPDAVSAAFQRVALHLPTFSGDVFDVPTEMVWPLLITAIPLGIFNFTEIINNVESASAGGDEFPLRQVMLADGLGAIGGAFLGSPFPPAVYIGHPGWKAMGGRVGYSLATGVSVAIMCFFGLAALLLSIIPLVAIVPILLFIGMVIGAQAFQATPKHHAPAIVLALVPNISEWARSQISSTLAATGVDTHQIPAELLRNMAGKGVLFEGMAVAGGGAVLAGLMLGAIAAFIIERRFNWAAVYTGAAAALSFFGFIHSEHLAFNASPSVSLGYTLSAIMLAFMAWQKAKEDGHVDWSPIDNGNESMRH